MGNDSLNVARLLLGHLTGIECRRALARGWLLWVRAAVGTLLGACLLFLIWVWWLSARDGSSSIPADWLRIFLSATALVLLTITAVQAPAVLAGSLAGERERGILHMLLSTTASPREIVEGRLLGKLSQVGMIILAGIPIVAFLAPWNGWGVSHVLTMVLLLAAVGLGGGGLAVGASVVSRRGRDAQLTVYISMIVLTMSPLLGWVGLPPEAVGVLEWFNPYFSMNRLVWLGDRGSALATAGCWTLVGLAGTALAVWRLRPTCLAVGVTRTKTRRRGKAPVLRERPMLWKELYIERVSSLGRFGRWLGILLTVTIGGGSLVLAGMMAYSSYAGSDSNMASWASGVLATVLGGFGGTLFGWLLQTGVGLRASVSIASERERATWDALLMSPLVPSEIAVAKLVGSLYALRWMAGAMLLAWTLAVAVGAVSVASYVTWVVGTFVMCAFMAAIGVRCSLSLPTATRAMSWTIALWLVAWPVVAFVAISVIGLVFLVCVSIWGFGMTYGLVSPTSRPWFPMSMSVGWALTTNLTALLCTIMVVADTSLRFDRIAGRMAGGKMATTVDAFVHGNARQAVFLPDERPARREAKSPAELPPAEEAMAPTAQGG